jgi:hypothetical protein
MRSIVVLGLTAICGTSLVAACATVEEAAVKTVAKTYHATLLGAEEPGGTGDPDGYGEADITVADELDNICWELKNIRNIGTITAAHIHRGARGVNGPPVFTLKQANEGGWKGCSNRSEWTEEAIETNPGNFYVNVHTPEHPNGAIRGQLRK